MLIPTLDQRTHFLKRLLDILCPQTTDEVEVLLETDKGEAHIGTKRNRLIAKATGDYVAFVDDDDRVSPDYVSRILGAIQTNPDCVGMEGIYTCEGRQKKFFSSLRHKTWHENGDLLWVDVQGAEKNLIAGGRETLSKTRYCFMEKEHIELYKGEALRDELISLMDGFVVLEEFEQNILFANPKFADPT